MRFGTGLACGKRRARGLRGHEETATLAFNSVFRLLRVLESIAKMLKAVSATVILLLAITSDFLSPVASQCQGNQDGFAADSRQCDKYYECVGGEATENLCPDGLVFDETITKFPRCDLPALIDCGSRTELQPAQPSPGCPRQWGFYASEDSRKCGEFVRCVEGIAHPTPCPDGLAYSAKTGNCEWPDEVDGCNAEELVGFKCPDLSSSPRAFPFYLHPRFPHTSDCRRFFICVRGISPRLLGCDEGRVFNPATLACDEPDNVSGCERYYSA